MSTMYQDPYLDYYGLDPQDDPADSPVYGLSILFDSYDDTREVPFDDNDYR